MKLPAQILTPSPDRGRLRRIITDLPSVAELRKRSMFWSTATFHTTVRCSTGMRNRGGRPDLAQGGFHVIGADRSYGMLARAVAKTCPWAKRIRTSYKWMRRHSRCSGFVFDAILSTLVD